MEDCHRHFQVPALFLSLKQWRIVIVTFKFLHFSLRLKQWIFVPVTGASLYDRRRPRSLASRRFWIEDGG
jgi:hypothetical protein